MAELTPIIKDSFLNYAGAVLQSRALVDVRDCIKPSARQIFYCMYTDKFVHSKPYQKTLKAIGSAFRLYIHGDSSAEGVIMRAGQPFAMRYPLVEVEGSYGTLLASASWAAPRYTSARLTALSEYLFKDIQKDTVKEWRDNYDNTEQYPVVLPSKGFFNIVNGSFGLAVGAAASVPQYNLKELNEALIKLLWNPAISFDDIYIIPDFATGAVLLNATEVKESHRNGNGAACKLRSLVDFDSKERCLVVTEIPYMVYTETICKQLEEIILGDENPGIERFNDLTGKTPLIKIYLIKTANPDKVLKFLYKNTSLQSYYGVNFTMLDNGRYPKVFTWKELLQAHLDHEKEVYTCSFEFDLRKINERLHIIEALLRAIAQIDEVVKTIKSSASGVAASLALQKLLSIDEPQAKAILDIKLSRLAHLEVDKLEKEKTSLLVDKERIEAILADEILLKKEIEKGLREVADKFGDARRTKILDISTDTNEPTEIKTLQVSLTNKNSIYLTEVSSLYTQKRGGVGNKIKFENGEYTMCTQSIESNEEIMFFTQFGNFYHYPAAELPIGERITVESLFSIKDYEKIKAMVSLNKKTDKSHILFFTKNGYVKKSLLSEYNLKRNASLRAIVLEPNDEIVNIIVTDNENVGILTNNGNFLMIATADISPIGRLTKGIRAIKLNEGDFVVRAKAIPKTTTHIITVTSTGHIKSVSKNELNIQNKNTKGTKIQKLSDTETMASFLPVFDETEVLLVSTRTCLKMAIREIPILSKLTQGNKAITLKSEDKILEISHC